MTTWVELPDRVAGYATYELVERLAQLTPQQRAAIDRIVQHVYIENCPLAQLFRGDDRICAEPKYYQRGVIDEETGRWVRRPGWHHDKVFQDALAEAVRLALLVRTREELRAMQSAARAARLAMPRVITGALEMANAELINKDGKPEPRGTEDKDRLAAMKFVYEVAGATSETGADAVTESAEADWWRAAEGDQ